MKNQSTVIARRRATPEPPPRQTFPYTGDTQVLAAFHPDRTQADRLAWQLARSIALGKPPGIDACSPSKLASIGTAAGATEVIIDAAMVPSLTMDLERRARAVQDLHETLDDADVGVVLVPSGRESVCHRRRPRPESGNARAMVGRPLHRPASRFFLVATGRTPGTWPPTAPSRIGWPTLCFEQEPNARGVWHVSSIHLPTALDMLVTDHPDMRPANARRRGSRTAQRRTGPVRRRQRLAKAK